MVAIEEGFDPDRVHVIYNSLDYELQKEVRDAVTPLQVRDRRTELFGDPDIPIVICAVRLMPSKRLDMLLEAVALLNASGHTTNVLLVGDGPERISLEALAAQKGVTVRFWGECYDERVLASRLWPRVQLCHPVRSVLRRWTVWRTEHLSYRMTNGITRGQWRSDPTRPNRDFFRKNDIASLSEAIRRQTDPSNRSERVREQCIGIIERFWNPAHQVRCILRALDGYPADDLLTVRKPSCCPFHRGNEDGDEGC